MEDEKPDVRTREQSKVRPSSQPSDLPTYPNRTTDKRLSHQEQRQTTSLKANLSHPTKFGVTGSVARPQQVWQKAGLPPPLILPCCNDG